MSHPEFLKLLFDGDEAAPRTASSPSNNFIMVLGHGFAVPQHHNKEVKLDVSRRLAGALTRRA